MGDVTKILNHMFHSKYTFFGSKSIGQHIDLEEKRVREVVKSMVKHDVVKETHVIDGHVKYFLPLSTRYLLVNLLGWRR